MVTEKKLFNDIDSNEMDNTCGGEETVETKFFEINSHKKNLNRLNLDHLSKEEEVALFLDYKNTGSEDALNRIVGSHMNYVISFIKRSSLSDEEFNDLMQEGTLGLIQAAKKYDPLNEFGARFSTFCKHFILSNIKAYIIDNSKIVRNYGKKPSRKLFWNLRNEQRKLNDESSNPYSLDGTGISHKNAEKIAEILNVPIQDVYSVDQALLLGDQSFNIVKSDGSPILDVAGAKGPEDHLLSVQNEWLTQFGIPQAMQALDARSQKIISARWSLSEDEASSATLADLAKEFGISAERVRQIESAAFKKMKGILSQAMSEDKRLVVME